MQVDTILEALLEISDGIITGVIVNHEDLVLQALGSTLHAVDTLFKIVAYVIVDYDN